MKNQAEKIRAYLLANVEQHPQDIVAVCAKNFNITRTTVHRHLTYLLQAHLIGRTGTTKSCSYYLKLYPALTKRFILSVEMDEFELWKKYFSNLIVNASQNVYAICEYGLTEMLNNAKDHSAGSWVEVSLKWQDQNIIVSLEDNGVGIFSKLRQHFNFSQIRESILELSKGKVTTDPVQHTGEGIFFSARAFETFTVEANGFQFTRDNLENDWFLQAIKPIKRGTRFVMQINGSSAQDLKSLFIAYQNEGTLEFNKTEIIVALSQLGGERFISRSQAKRVLRGLDKFEIIVLDFKDVVTVGQGFVDEVIRVYQSQHPSVILKSINANDDVAFMINRSLIKDNKR